MAGTIATAVHEADILTTIITKSLQWQEGRAVNFHYAGNIEKIPPIKHFSAGRDNHRPKKLRLLKLLDQVSYNLKNEYKDKDGFPTEREFSSSLDPQKMKPLREQETSLTVAKIIATARLTSILRDEEFLLEFDQLPSLRQIQVLVRVTDSLADNQVGRSFLKDAVQAGQTPKMLLDPERLNNMISNIGINSGTVNHPDFSFISGSDAQKIAENVLGTTDPKTLISNFCSLYSLFASSVIPLVMYGSILREERVSPTIQALAGNCVKGLLPAGAIGPNLPPQQLRESIRDYINNHRTGYLAISDQIISTLSVALQMYTVFVSLNKLVTSSKPVWENVGELLRVVSDSIILTENLLAKTTGETAKKLAQRAASIAGVVVLAVDFYVTVKNIETAGEYGDRSVQAGQAISFTGAAIGTAAAVYGAFFAAGVGLGPVGWAAMGIGIGVTVLGQFIITYTTDPPLESFANTCWFGKNPSGSKERDHIHYGFYKIQGETITAQPDLGVQIDRLRTMLNPLGYTIRTTTTNFIYFKYLRHQNGQFPLSNNSSLRIRLSETEQNLNNFTNSMLTKLKQDGEVSGLREDFRVVKNKWSEMLVTFPVHPVVPKILGANSEEARPVRLIEYQKIP